MLYHYWARTNLRKIIRFTRIYGPRRTFIKALGRSGRAFPAFPGILPHKRLIGLIGCGQYSFSTSSYFLAKNLGNRFHSCFDINHDNASQTKKTYRYKTVAPSAADLIADDEIEVIYISSNHASHAPYAVAGLRAGKVVYCEKPIAVSFEQLKALEQTIRATKGTIYCGYNRPFSPAIRSISKQIRADAGPITFQCFVTGHDLPEDHWYRNPAEGTRICGNVGHWIDLAVHLLCKRSKLPKKWDMQIAYSDRNVSDENIAISMTTERGDLINITLTARSEPFEGINETIALQQGDFAAKIDDFRQLQIWRGDGYKKCRYWPKDVGHESAVLQPFRSADLVRDWSEVTNSTLLMLELADMVRARERQKLISLEQTRQKIV